MKMNKILTTIFIIISSITVSNCQNNKSLEELGIDNYYSKAEAENNIFSNIEIEYKSISNTPINEKFNNINDLSWLVKIASDNKVILVGETHYSRYIGNIVSRMFFTINKYDYYPIIILEKPYSITEYINYYFSIKDDKVAEEYFNQELKEFIPTEEDATFYRQIREWNKFNKAKPLKIGATDLEFNIKRTLNNIIRPYLNELNNISKTKIDSLITQGLSLSDDFFTNISMIIEKEENKSIIGKYPFINYRYIKNVIENLRDTKIAYKSNFNINRHNTIIRNLIDTNFLGLYMQNSKVMLYGGGDHMITKFYNVDSTDVPSEGIFLTNEYEPTKGKTFSIMLNGMGAYSLDEMANRSLNECLRQGTQYNIIINRLKKAYDNGLISQTKPYYIFFKRNELEKLIVNLSYKNNGNSIIISNKSWDEIVRKINHLPEDKKDIYKNIINSKKMFDEYIFIPYSPINTARYK